MKAILLTQDFLPDLPGGIAIYYYHLCRCLGGGISVLTPRLGDAAEFDAAQPFPIHRRRIPIVPPSFMRDARVPYLRWPRIGYLAASQLSLFYRHGRRLMKAEGADVALIGHLYLAPLGRLLRRGTGKRYGVVLFSGELHRYMGWKPVRQVMLNALNAADFLIVISEFARRQYLEMGVRTDQRFVRINPGVDSSVFRPDAGDPGMVRQRHGVGDRPLIVSVARLVEWKGHDTVLRALPHMLAEVPEAVYLIVGDGPYRPDLERLTRRLGLEDRVVFAGFVPEGDLPSYYRAADVVAVPSREVTEGVPIEGFGIVYVEAGACGTAVVGGRGGGTDESIEDGVTGFRVDANDTSELADAVVRLLKDRELAQRFGRAGRERAVKLFDWSIQAERLSTFLEDLVAEG